MFLYSYNKISESFRRLHPHFQKARILNRSDLPKLCADITIVKTFIQNLAKSSDYLTSL
jgi:hypothetical protein